MSDLQNDLDNWLTPLINQLSPPQRRQLAKNVARDIRQSNRDRIKAQQNPDGTAFQPRKTLRNRTGQTRRRAMFSKIRTAKYLKIKTTADTAAIQFVGRVAHIARVHQYGLRDRVEKNGPQHQYAQRRLLGISDADKERIQNSIITHLTDT